MALTNARGTFRVRRMSDIQERALRNIVSEWGLGQPVDISDLSPNRSAQFVTNRADPLQDFTQSEGAQFLDKIWWCDGLREVQDQFALGFEWDSGDRSVGYWMPQGITGSYSATGAGSLWGGRKLILVSWYCKDRDTEGSSSDWPVVSKGARVSVVDVTEWQEPLRYRHILLVRPIRDSSGNASYEELLEDNDDAVHAGGLAWHGNLLYVAGTTRLYGARSELRGFSPTCGRLLLT